MTLTEHWKLPDGVVHIVGLHQGLHKDRLVFSECGIHIATLMQLATMPLMFLQGNTGDAATCLVCLTTSEWETYAPRR